MSSSKPAGRGGGEHWSDGETEVLVEKWGQLYLGRNRGPVRDADWRQVCSAVNAHRAAAGHRFDRSIAQCQCRLYGLKSQYKKELAKGHPTSGWRHFAQLRAILSGPDDGPPPGFAARMPAAFVVKEEEVEEKKEEEASGSVGRRTVPAKRHFSSLHDISGGLPSVSATKMPAAKKEKEAVEEEEVKEEVEEVEREEPANGAASAGYFPAKVVRTLAEVVTKLAEVYERVEMKRLSVEQTKMEVEWEKSLQGAAKVEAENLGETETTTNQPTNSWSHGI